MMSYSLFDTDTFSMCCEARSWCLRVEIKGQKKKKNEINEKLSKNCIMYCVVAGQDSAGEGWLGAPLRVRS